MNKTKSTALRFFLSLSLLIAACFLLPNAARPAFAAESLRIAGTDVTDGTPYIADSSGTGLVLAPDQETTNYLIYSVGQNGENVIFIEGNMDITVPDNTPFVNEPVTINTTGNLTITGNTTGSLVNGALTIGSADDPAASVTIQNNTSENSSNPVLNGDVNIYAENDVSISGNTTHDVIYGECLIDTSGKVTLKNTNTDSNGKVLEGESTINTTGDVEITAHTTNAVVRYNLHIGSADKRANSVTIKNTSDTSASTALIYDGSAAIYAKGDVTITGNTTEAIVYKTCQIDTTSGNVTLENTGTGTVIRGQTTINTTGDVKIIGNTEMNLTGALLIGNVDPTSKVDVRASSVTIENKNTSSSSCLIYGTVVIYATGDVSITGNASEYLSMSGSINTLNGDVTLENTGSGKLFEDGFSIFTSGDVAITGNTTDVLMHNSLKIGGYGIGSADDTDAKFFRAASVTIENKASSTYFLLKTEIYATGSVSITGNTSYSLISGTCLIDTSDDVTLTNSSGGITSGPLTVNTTGAVSITGRAGASLVVGKLSIGSESAPAESVTIKDTGSNSPSIINGSAEIYTTDDIRITGNTTTFIVIGDLTIGSSNVPARSVEITNTFTPSYGYSSSSSVVSGFASIFATGNVSITGHKSNSESLIEGTLTIGSDTVHAASITLTNKEAAALDKEPTIFGFYEMKAGTDADSAAPVENPTADDYKNAYVQLTAHTHDFTGEWKSDSTGHWHECPADGTLSDKQPHTFGDWTTSGDKRTRTCECGYSETETVTAPVTPDVDVPTTVLNGWKTLPQGTVYYKNSVKLKGWQTIDRETYYFDAKGYLQTGWLRLNENWYYLDSAGARQTGWVKVKNSWYYLGSDGVMLSATWLNDGGKWYYLAPSGAMYNNQWRCTKGVWYYLLGNGEMAKNRWIEDKGDWYYFGADGGMLVSTTAPDGSTIGADGKWIR